MTNPEIVRQFTRSLEDPRQSLEAAFRNTKIAIRASLLSTFAPPVMTLEAMQVLVRSIRAQDIVERFERSISPETEASFGESSRHQMLYAARQFASVFSFLSRNYKSTCEVHPDLRADWTFYGLRCEREFAREQVRELVRGLELRPDSSISISRPFLARMGNGLRWALIGMWGRARTECYEDCLRIQLAMLCDARRAEAAARAEDVAGRC